MWNPDEPRNRAWIEERLKRHFGELLRLSAPAVLMRVGILALAMVDTAIVGHYATEHLAWLNLANQSIVMFAIVVGLGLMTSIVVFTANAFGHGDMAACGRIWRRSLPFAALSGGLSSLPCGPPNCG